MSIKQERVTSARARLTRQGQISVPKAVRDSLGLEPGDELEFHVHGEGAVVTRRPARHLVDFAGIARTAASRIPPTAEQIDALIRAVVSSARGDPSRRGD